MKLRMKTSIAGTLSGKLFSAQIGEVIDAPADTGKKWVRGGLATEVPPDTPLTSDSDPLADLSMEEARMHHCAYCATLAFGVIGNKPLCKRHFRGAMMGG